MPNAISLLPFSVLYHSSFYSSFQPPSHSSCCNTLVPRRIEYVSSFIIAIFSCTAFTTDITGHLDCFDSQYSLRILVTYIAELTRVRLEEHLHIISPGFQCDINQRRVLSEIPEVVKLDFCQCVELAGLRTLGWSKSSKLPQRSSFARQRSQSLSASPRSLGPYKT